VLGTLAADNGIGSRGRGTILVRPEDLGVALDGVLASVVETRCLGAYDRTVVQLASGEELLLHLPAGSAPAAGTPLRIALRQRHPHFLPERPPS
jgi:hypothetical protein